MELTEEILCFFQVDSSNKENVSNTQEKTSTPSGSRFGRFGSQLFQKTVGLVIRSRDKQVITGILLIIILTFSYQQAFS